jgi:hypothetical protein
MVLKSSTSTFLLPREINTDSQVCTTKDPPTSSTTNSGCSSLGTTTPNLLIRILDDLLFSSNVVLGRTLYYLGHL